MERHGVTAVTVAWWLCFQVLRVCSVTTMPDPVTFRNAMAYCRQNQRQVLTDRDSHERALLKSIMVQKNWSTVWLAVEGERFKNYTWLDGHKDASDENWDINDNCGFLHIKAKSVDKRRCADTSIGYLCEGNASSCRFEGIQDHKCIEAGGRAFVYSCDGSSWYQARTTCADRGTTLAIIHDSDVKNEILLKLHATKCGMWVGLRRKAWFYITNNGTRGHEILEPKWERSEPSIDGNCVVLHKNGGKFQWKVASCTSAHHTACFNSDIQEDVSTTTDVYQSVSMKYLKTTTVAPPINDGVNIWLILGPCLGGVAVLTTFVIICVLVKRNKKNKDKREDEEEGFITAEQTMELTAPPPYDSSTEWYADSEGGRYSAEYKIELFIPGGAVPEDKTYKISRLISNDIFSCQAVTGHEDHRVICPVVQFECLEDFLKPVTIHLPHAVAKLQLLKEVRVLYQEPGTTKWFTINSDNTTRNSLVLVGDQNANREERGLNNLSMSYEITVKNLNIHTKHLGKFMCSMPAPSLEDTSLSAMLFAHVTEDPSDKVVQEVVLQAVVLDNMYNLPCFKQCIYEEYGGKPVKENISITLPSDRLTGDRGVLQVDLGTREEEYWTVYGSSSKSETKETRLSELHKGLQNELGILVCEIHLQNKGIKVNSVMVTASLSVGQEDSENGQSYQRTPVTKNFRVPLRPSEEDQLQGDSGCGTSSKGSSTRESRGTSDSGRNVRSPTTYSKPSRLFNESSP